MPDRSAQYRTAQEGEPVKFLLKRLGFYALAGWAAVTLNFFLPRLMPGDPTDAIQLRYCYTRG